MTHLTVSVLGELQVLIDDVTIQTFESDKVRALLAYLAVEADHSHRRETLIGLLWPDCPEETARHNLRQALFNLRLALGDHTASPSYLLISRDAIQFNRESDYSLDMDQFNAYFRARERNRNLENEDATVLVSQIDEIVKLYRGQFLQHFSLSDSAEFEGWILMRREALRQHMMDALTYLANEYESRGDFQAARRYATRQLELEPWREEAHCQIMRVLALSGERSAALAQYETCRQVLAEELGVAPAPETTALYQQIRERPIVTNKPAQIATQVEAERKPGGIQRQPQPTGTVTFLFTDIEGSTRLWEQHSEAMPQAFARQEAILRAAMVAHHGYIYKMIGDAFQVAFSTAPEAVAAALEAQMGLVSEHWGEIGTLKVRMALHTGVTEERGDDYVGPELNRVARLLGAGYGGQVLMNQLTYELVRDQLPKDVSLRDLGWHQLRDLVHPEHIYQVVAPGLPEAFPLLKSAQRVNLPTPTTPFIGREAELAKIERLLADPDCRLVSLIGIGGSGKTCLALQAAYQCRNEFAHGAGFIPLAPVSSIEAVIPSIASAINFAFYGPSDPQIQLLNYLRDKKMLLIVDNVEHLLMEQSHRGTIADLLIEILRGANQIKLLVTSREALNLQEEWLFEVKGLSFPEAEQSDQWNEFDSVTLFAQRARRARPGFELNAEDKTGVIRVCRLVEGMPLAIELAAAWVRILSPAEIAKEVEKSLDFLNTKMRDVPERHRSIRAVFDYSWQMLTKEEKLVLGKLSVFRGGFGRQAAEQIAGASLPILSSLVIRSLLQPTATGRYNLHELIRQYASSKLAADPGELHTVQERHSLYYLRYLEERDARLRSNQQKEALAELIGELGNIRTAWDWALIQQKIIPLARTSATLWYLFELHNWFKEGEVTFWNTSQTLRGGNREADPNEAKVETVLNMMLAHHAYFQFRQGKSEEAYATLAPCAAFLRTGADPLASVYSLLYLGIVCWELGRFSEAEESLQESLRLTRQYGMRWYEAWVSEFLGIVAHEEGRYNKAQQYLSEALAITREIKDRLLIAHVLSYLSRTTRMLGEYSVAEELLWESLGLAREIGYRSGIGLALDALGQVTYAQGKYEEAHTHFSESSSLFQEIGDTYRLARVLIHQGLNFLALNQVADAQNVFSVALTIAHKGGFLPTTLEALTGLAALETRRKANPGILELVIYILRHQASTQEAKNLAAQLRVELQAKFNRKEIESAQQHTGSKSLDEFVRQFQTNS